MTPQTSSSAALEALEAEPFDLLNTDLKIPNVDGLGVLQHVRKVSPELPVILITAHATVDTAVAAIRAGAFDYVEKPFDNDELKMLVQRALDVTRLSRENRYLRAEVRSRYALDAVVAESVAMQKVLDFVRRAARSPSTVLVTGERGTGKELIARAVHYHSERVGKPFVAVNCKAVAEGFLESELFGHEKGAVTGADRAKPGLFERADGGTLFLDEIGEISGDFQAKLLRVLREKTIQRVGGTAERSVGVRLVAAANRDLQAEVKADRFGEDLYFRLDVIPIHIPPLRERQDDVLPLARHFLEKWNTECGCTVQVWTPEVEQYLASYLWPGNVRELENTIERAVVLAEEELITSDDLLIQDRSSSNKTGETQPETFDSLQAFLGHAAAECIQTVLKETNGDRTEAARRLRIDRTTLYRLMRKFGVSGEG